MLPFSLIVAVLSCFPSRALASHGLSSRALLTFASPLDGGGSMLNNAGGGLGEPLNVIISGLSSPNVLTNGGILNYARSLGFSNECFNVHLGDPQSANLGDGNGPVNQTIELRQDFGDAAFGTCFESLIGGNHFRVYRQNGPKANTGALFLAVSHEEDVSQHHTISLPDGYDNGRDLLVAAATAGDTFFDGALYNAVAQNVTGLLPVGAVGINHNIPIDGVAVLLTVTIANAFDPCANGVSWCSSAPHTMMPQLSTIAFSVMLCMFMAFSLL
ncbi:hypothetical protein BD410DRAFT_770158 [Rickenella mellea]|uniref:Uncharacterized protein n=1 Tax=Rickenella mellea TaxID=50990 RepID=A0A4Y7Q4M7_9AGAM|nr:hypothetical protein BD410DRAFT_770158 [Rickenella mellea]